MSAPIKLTRKELYDLVWSEPVTKIGAKFGVSDVAIAKICKKLNVPRPPRGYWARKQYGYPTEKRKLPKASAGTPHIYELNPPDIPKMAKSVLKPPKIIVPEQLQRSHNVAKAIRSELKGCRVDDFGRIGQSDGPMHVSKAAYSRACRILDALFKALESRGHIVEIRDNQICISIENETVHLAVSEPTKRTEDKADSWGYRRWIYVPTGKLVLALSARYLKGVRQQWGDGKVQRVEDILGRLIVSLEQAPNVIKVGRDEAERRKREWERRRLRSRREKDVIRLSHERAQCIDRLMADLKKADEIRRFIEAVRDTELVPKSVLRQARWARIYADHVDPFIDFRLEPLDKEPSTYFC